MKPSIQKLYNIFKIEAENQYFNRAVIGGLPRILDKWVSEAREDAVPEALIQLVQTTLRKYPHLPIEERSVSLSHLWDNIRTQFDTTTPITFPGPEATLKEVSTPSQPKTPRPARKSTPPPKKPAAPASAHNIPTVDQPVDQNALNAPIRVLPGIGQKYANVLSRLGIYTLGDLLYFFPRRYDDYSHIPAIRDLHYGQEVTVLGILQSVTLRRTDGRRSIVEAILTDGSGAVRITIFNQPWQANKLQIGAPYAIAGRVEQYLGRLCFINPEIEPLEEGSLNSGRIVPVYRLTENISQRWLRKTIKQVVDYYAPKLVDYLPPSIRESAGLIELSHAVMQTHFPDSHEELKAARYRLAFDEIFLLQIKVLRQKYLWGQRAAERFFPPEGWLDKAFSVLPYHLTEAQQRAIEEALQDFASGRPMNRLLQGDVGSGKTVVAAILAALIAQNGAQSAIMAPTSILAEQHYRTFLKLLTSTPNVDSHNADTALVEPLMSADAIRLLTGATPDAERRELLSDLAEGKVRILIGTHALIEDPVQFNNLQFIVVDEQHRFGVEQRAMLRSKGTNPHLLVMTATPVPRSLALTIYGDLDLSLLDEMPPGRQPVATYIALPKERERVYSLIKSQVEQGKQAFIIYPLVEESEKIPALSAVEEAERLQKEIFPKFKVGLLHGRMSAEEKDEVMRRFQNGDLQILVSTSVVEVGVDIPQATVMVIEGANRFGLAQLHQFRGRVGRGNDPATCILIPQTADEAENERLMVMTRTQNGFELAEFDLQQRGPGDFLGKRQSGFAQAQFASFTNLHLIEHARQVALKFFESDPRLENPQHQLLAKKIELLWQESPVDIS